jgi:peptidyl-dipeptidase A
MKTIHKSVAFTFVIAMLLLTSCESETMKMENKLKGFIANYEERVKPLYTESNLAYWDASISGKAEDWARSENAQLKLTDLTCQQR